MPPPLGISLEGFFIKEFFKYSIFYDMNTIF